MSDKGGQTRFLCWIAPDDFVAVDYTGSAKPGQTRCLYWMAPGSFLAGD